MGVCSLQSKCLIILNLINQNFPQDIVQYPIVLVSSGFDDSSIPLLMFSTSFTFLYLNCFLHAVIYFVHCALSLIILLYIHIRALILVILKCLFILVCRSKSPTGLMLHVV